jgi:conjugal transfer ATP-binding protein TraC
MMMTQALIGSLPATLSALSRGPQAHEAGDDEDFLQRRAPRPLIAEWQGTGTPVLLFGPARPGDQLDVYDNPAGNYNARSPALRVQANRCC